MSLSSNSNNRISNNSRALILQHNKNSSSTTLQLNSNSTILQFSLNSVKRGQIVLNLKNRTIRCHKLGVCRTLSKICRIMPSQPSRDIPLVSTKASWCKRTLRSIATKSNLSNSRATSTKSSTGPSTLGG